MSSPIHDQDFSPQRNVNPVSSTAQNVTFVRIKYFPRTFNRKKNGSTSHQAPIKNWSTWYGQRNSLIWIINLKKLSTTFKDLRNKVRYKIIDISKVDKGNLVLIIDFEQRVKLEEINVSKIAQNVCPAQSSNWQKMHIDDAIMIELFDMNFIDRNALVANLI